MRITLADHVHGVAVDGDLVLLDTEADVYFCLPAGDFTALVTGRTVETTPDALGASLCEALLASPAYPATDRADVPPQPRRTARAELDADPHLKATPATLRHLNALARSVSHVRRSVRRPFVERLGGASAARSTLTPTLLRDLAVYRRLAPWLPIDGPCFFRSDMLRAYLAALGHGVVWCFGVRTWPFHAHCWLQVEDVVLDDEAERLAPYRPIVAV